MTVGEPKPPSAIEPGSTSGSAGVETRAGSTVTLAGYSFGGTSLAITTAESLATSQTYFGNFGVPRTRLTTAALMMIVVFGIGGLPILPSASLAPMMIVALVVLFAAGAGSYLAARRADRGLYDRLMLVALAATVPVVFVLDSRSPIIGIVVLIIILYNLDAPPRWALAATLIAGVPQVALQVLALLHIIERTTVLHVVYDFRPELSFTATLTVLFGVAYAIAHLYRNRTGTILRELGTAGREIAARSALLREARQDLERVAAIGQRGRFTEQLLGSFVLGNILGRGGMGEIYEATHVTTGERAAVKLLRLQEHDPSSQVQRFRREAAIISALSSPHIVRLLEVGGLEAPLPYLAMERLEGEDLAEILRRESRLSLQRVVDLVQQVGEGLSTAARHGIVHRDIKPSNLFRTDDGEWKILDFGLGRLAGESSTLTGSVFVGTFGYAAPEQLDGSPVSVQTDLHSLGVVVYRALTGHNAFVEREPAGILRELQHELPFRPSEVVAVPPEVDDVLRIALAKSPSDRFADPAAMARALADAARGEIDPALRAKANALEKRIPWNTKRSLLKALRGPDRLTLRWTHQPAGSVAAAGTTEVSVRRPEPTADRAATEALPAGSFGEPRGSETRAMAAKPSAELATATMHDPQPTATPIQDHRQPADTPTRADQPPGAQQRAPAPPRTAPPPQVEGVSLVGSIDDVDRSISLSRIRAIAGVFAVAAIYAYSQIQMYPDPWMKIFGVVTISATFLAICGVILAVRDQSEASMRRYHIGAIIVAIAASLLPYLSVYGIVAVFVTIGLLLYSFGASHSYARVMYVVFVVPHVAMHLGIVLGWLADRGPIEVHASLAARLWNMSYIVALHTLSLTIGGVYRAHTRQTLTALTDAFRRLAEREALLQEARLELERVIGVGQPGRFTGQRVGAFVLGPVLGRGGMGDVYEATHDTTGEPAAVKLLQRRDFKQHNLIERFEREARTAASLSSLHIVKVLEVGTDDAELPYIAMERMVGSTLGELLQGRLLLSASEVADMVAQIADGLAVAHAAGVVHRDIKPQNLFRTDDGMWKVMDFGIAALEGEPTAAAADRLMGTPAYMAPEQLDPSFGEVGPRTDLHALGAVAYRALTGRPAFDGRDAMAIVKRVLQSTPAPASTVAEVPKPIDSVLQIAMAKRPVDRYDDVATFARAFKAATAAS